MSSTTLTRLFGAGRLVVGTALAAAPRAAAQTWIGGDAERPGAQVMTVAMGVRDAAIGAGVLRTAGTDAGRAWVLAGVVSDAADLVATLRAEGLPQAGRIGTAAIATGAVVGGLWLLAQDA
jgi:hypothetical protein